jgi:hypothetical protein
MLGTTLPTPMYSLYAGRMDFATLTTTVIFTTYAAVCTDSRIGEISGCNVVDQLWGNGTDGGMDVWPQ